MIYGVYTGNHHVLGGSDPHRVSRKALNDNLVQFRPRTGNFDPSPDGAGIERNFR